MTRERKLTHSPIIIAHRGANKQAPENAKLAFDIALSQPIDGIEFDVQLTKDQAPVIFHDPTLTKINGSRKAISDYTYADLKSFDWGTWFSESYAGEPILTLQKLFELYADSTRLLIEIKSRKSDSQSKILTRKVVSLIESHIPTSRWENIYILSFNINVLTYASSLNSGIRLVFNVPDADFNTYARVPVYTSLYGVCLPIKYVNKPTIRKIKLDGKVVFSYSCNLRSQLMKLRECDIDFILTDKPDWLVKTLNLCH